MVEGERTLLVQGAGGGQTWVFGSWNESADAKDDDCGCADDECDACAEIDAELEADAEVLQAARVRGRERPRIAGPLLIGLAGSLVGRVIERDGGRDGGRRLQDRRGSRKKGTRADPRPDAD